MMIATGDQDICYYNFACAYPYQLVMDFSDFNHFFSNIGYIVLGTIFLLITKRRDYIHCLILRENSSIKEVVHTDSRLRTRSFKSVDLMTQQKLQ